ncbi:MAG TPA: hypothetical protein VGC62_15375 [Pseudomonas sp.]|uniref:hypothetical protein n=1 Tax=Pseudomonas sp. TaxID=306 RepID=UPI002ED841C3
MTRAFTFAAALLVIGAGASLAAHAHTLLCECQEIASDQVQCKGGFAHGSGASGITVDVIDYDENTVVAGKFADDSTFTFKRPAGEFYVLMDMGAGHTLEVDYTEIKKR